MSENPYSSPKTDMTGRGSEPVQLEPFAAGTADNPFLGPLFAWRKYTLLAFACFLSLAALRLQFWIYVQPWVPILVEMAVVFAVVVFAVTLIAFQIFLFLTAHHHGGIVYALGHVAVSMFLTPAVLLGVLLIPVLIRGDIERMADDSVDTIA